MLEDVIRAHDGYGGTVTLARTVGVDPYYRVTVEPTGHDGPEDGVGLDAAALQALGAAAYAAADRLRLEDRTAAR